MRKREATTAEIRERINSFNEWPTHTSTQSWIVSACKDANQANQDRATLINRIENLERRASFWETNYNASEEKLREIGGLQRYDISSFGTIDRFADGEFLDYAETQAILDKP